MGALAAQPLSGHAIEEFARAAERFAVATSWSDMRAVVPACPGWTVHDLVVHLGNVHAWAATVVETRQPAVEQNDEPRGTRSKAVSEWYAAKAEDLYQALRSTSLETPCWNFVSRVGTVAFWPRRQLHETTVHLLDLDLACGRESALDALVCADGVDEVLTLMLRRMHHRGHPAALEAPLLLRATDTGRRWLLTPAPDLPPRVDGDPPARTRGADRIEAPAEALYRMLWHRPFDTAAVHVQGDAERVRAFVDSRLTP